MRGAVALAAEDVRHLRIIPARAGSRGTVTSAARAGADHPRACGEQCTGPTSCAACGGSSPRVRGAVVLWHAVSPSLRIIPARAGSSHRASFHPTAFWDHPRACGEQGRTSRARGCRGGSSPRVRGAVHERQRDVAPARIIPARAGSSSFSTAARSMTQDHPRACGEQLHVYLTCEILSGSSPRVRGAVGHSDASYARIRIIPARAGSSLKNGLLNSLAHFSSYSLSISFINRSRVERQSGSAR